MKYTYLNDYGSTTFKTYSASYGNSINESINIPILDIPMDGSTVTLEAYAYRSSGEIGISKIVDADGTEYALKCERCSKLWCNIAHGR